MNAQARFETLPRSDWTREQIAALFALPFTELVFRAAAIHRAHFDPTQVQTSTLINIKTGGCPEDCGYCSQSSKYDTGIKATRLMAVDEVLADAAKAKAAGASRFCMGAAWRSPNARDLEKMCALVEGVRGLGLETCVTAGMLTLVVAENTIQLLLGWELMGLCSFMLIGHWWEDQKNSDAALKAFFTTRTGDIGLLIGIIVVFWGAGVGQTTAISEAIRNGIPMDRMSSSDSFTPATVSSILICSRTLATDKTTWPSQATSATASCTVTSAIENLLTRSWRWIMAISSMPPVAAAGTAVRRPRILR